jgi:hypothetical protein
MAAPRWAFTAFLLTAPLAVAIWIGWFTWRLWTGSGAAWPRGRGTV